MSTSASISMRPRTFDGYSCAWETTILIEDSDDQKKSTYK